MEIQWMNKRTPTECGGVDDSQSVEEDVLEIDSSSDAHFSSTTEFIKFCADGVESQAVSQFWLVEVESLDKKRLDLVAE